MRQQRQPEQPRTTKARTARQQRQPGQQETAGQQRQHSNSTRTSYSARNLEHTRARNPRAADPPDLDALIRVHCKGTPSSQRTYGDKTRDETHPQSKPTSHQVLAPRHRAQNWSASLPTFDRRTNDQPTNHNTSQPPTNQPTSQPTNRPTTHRPTSTAEQN
jgi:hypothetical protein